MDGINDIPGGYRVGTQVPLDGKVIKLALIDLLDLGDDDNLAFTYVEQMIFHCINENKDYQWREPVGGEIGLLPGNFQYPDGVEAFGIDYSLRFFNIFEVVYNSGVIPYLELRLITKGPGNTDPTKINVLEVGDTVQGRKDSDIVWTEARYDGGNPQDRANYTPLVETSLGNPNPGGPPGETGADGKSAYEIAVENGFSGSEEEWLESLEGADGLNGLSAYQVAVNNGFVGTESQWLISLKGASGTNGTNGTNGKSAYQVALDNGFIGTEAQWLASIEGTDGADASNNLQRDQSVSFILADTDNNQVIQLKNGATAITVTLPATGLRSKFNVGFKFKGTGNVSFLGASGVTLINPIGFKGKGLGYCAYIERDGNTQNYDLLGDTKV